MYIRLIRNEPKGNAITGRLVINGRWFCNTLERVGYQIPSLCYHVAVTMSPKFKRLLPIVQNVPQTGDKARGDKAMRQGIRFHRGTKPEHSTGCILVVADNRHGVEWCRIVQNGVELSSLKTNNATQPYTTLHNSLPPQGRTSADVEQELTRLILKAQKEREEIILEVSDFRPGTEYGYNTLCPSSECAREKEIRSANFARRQSSSILEPTRLSDGC